MTGVVAEWDGTKTVVLRVVGIEVSLLEAEFDGSVVTEADWPPVPSPEDESKSEEREVRIT